MTKSQIPNLKLQFAIRISSFLFSLPTVGGDVNRRAGWRKPPGEIPESLGIRKPGQIRTWLQVEDALFTHECRGEIIQKALLPKDDRLFIHPCGREVNVSQRSQPSVCTGEFQLHIGAEKGNLLSAECPCGRSGRARHWNAQIAGDRFGQYRVVRSRISYPTLQPVSVSVQGQMFLTPQRSDKTRILPSPVCLAHFA